MVIAVDFDGTCVTHDFPKIGKDIGAAPVLKELVAKGHKLILFTMRSDIQEVFSEEESIHKVGGNYLTEAVQWFKDNEIPLFGINNNPNQSTWTTSPKAYADLYIDDAALGVPLKFDYDLSPLLFVDWQKAIGLLVKLKLL